MRSLLERLHMNDTILAATPLAFPWQTPDPFLFCAYHHDGYPAGNEKMGPAASLAGRNLGNDFEGKDGWRMYHGESVPGFPQHPHRGFETVTIARRGLIDHADSLGAVARFGRGDVQWVTAGRGLVHSEMFPLLDRNGPNPVELFQIWLNLPKADKLVDPHFTMLWQKDVPVHVEQDSMGRTTEVTVVAGRLGDSRPPAPPPRSWASHAEADVGIWTLRMDPKAEWILPPAAVGSNRTLYFFRGATIRVGDREIKSGTSIRLKADATVAIHNGSTEAEFLLLQGRPIAEPIVQYGPFVMNTRSEIEQAFSDYQQTQFGGWPWPSDDPVHPREEGRFARHADGRIEKP
ncbi:MAG: pirin family protein [Fibrobacterota bacterium]|nr:pirin family protein [Fibrobacterota bacterium]